ncbi:MAG: RpiB/LacA/LacB family sugar-phosphate isomerase [Candidatus Nomurabacteria bacterium]|jgi:ribose 5-phosphate isomerase B|nr:RpiB/LacA/LacB family sugar-phosphate isomerase [Candidatus Nomurabacteria bacterium]
MTSGTIYLGSDHRGWRLKGKIAAYLSKRGCKIFDVGDRAPDPADDFPQFAAAAALKLLADDNDIDKAILICGGGQGMAMAANRFRSVRAIVATTAEDAKLGRGDNDANVLCLPARVLDLDDNQYWQDIIDTFLSTEFSGAARFVRRNRQLDELS